MQNPKLEAKRAANKLGSEGEALVEKFYKKRGYKIAGRNVKLQGYKQLGELDLIAAKKRELVFIEVKTRSNSRFADPSSSVDWRKQLRLRKAVKAYLLQQPKYADYNCRLDVAIVDATVDKADKAVYVIEDAIQDE